MIEMLLEKPCWVIDFLPEQVAARSAGQFFAVERFYLQEPRYAALRGSFANILLKLNCYFDLEAGAPEEKQPKRNPAPERLFSWVTENQRDLCVLLPEVSVLITLNRNDTHMTVYNPPLQVLKRLAELAAAEGLFLWQPPRNEDRA